MPAREMFFTFNTGIELNKENVKSLKEMLEDFFNNEQLQVIKDAFCTEEFDKNFFKFFIKELKGFDSVSIDRSENSSDKIKSILPFVYDIIGEELTKGESPLELKYLYDEWDYEGCGHDDHYYLTFADESKEIKKFTKEAEKAVEKLRSIGLNAKLVIEPK